MRRVGPHDVSLQHAEAFGGAMDCVSLGHGPSRGGRLGEGPGGIPPRRATA
jgi:hypothetical protein